MSPVVALALLCAWTPGDHPPGFVWQQFPTERMCELNHAQCVRDSDALADRIEMLSGVRPPTGDYGGGWGGGAL
jgi:hypothetical protein